MIYIFSIVYALSIFMGKMTVGFAGKNIPIFYCEIFSLIGLVYLLSKRNKIKLITSKYLFILFYLFIISSVPILYSGDYLRSIEGPKTFFFMIISYILFTNLFISNNRKEAEKFILIFSYTFSLLVVAGIINIIFSNHLFMINSIYRYKEYFQLPFGKSNYIAAFLSYFAIVFFVEYFQSDRKIHLLLFMVLFLAVLIINSRTSIIATSVMLIIFIFANTRKISMKKKLFVFSILLIFIYQIMHTNFYSLLINRFQTETSNLTDRVISSKLVIEYLRSSNIIGLLFGQGMGTEKATLGITLIHNVWLKVFYSLGFIGGSLYFAYYIYYIKKLTKNPTNKKYIYSFSVLFIVSLAEPALFTPPIEYLICILISNSLIDYKV